MPKGVTDPNNDNPKIIITQAKSAQPHDIGEISHKLNLIMLRNEKLRDEYGDNRSAWLLDILRKVVKEYEEFTS